MYKSNPKSILKSNDFFTENLIPSRAYPALLERFKKMGHNEENLKRTLQYIRNEAPIIIHVNLDKILHLIVKDTHYRNQFETKTSGGYLQ